MLLPYLPAGRSDGFILLSAVAFVAVVLIIASAQAGTLLDEWRAVGREEQSLQALSAVDTAIACVAFHDKEKDAFDTRKLAQTYDCGVGSFTAGGVNVGAQECAIRTYQFSLAGFDNGACADVSVTTVPASFWAGGELVYVCDITVEARGRSSCAGSASRRVERVRTANF